MFKEELEELERRYVEQHDECEKFMEVSFRSLVPYLKSVVQCYEKCDELEEKLECLRIKMRKEEVEEENE